MEIAIQQSKEKQSIWDNFVPIIQTGRTYDVYLTEGIESPSEYNELCHLLKNAYTGDTFNLHINTPGGLIDSASMIIDALNTTKAHTVAYLTGSVASAGTLIALSCKDLVIAPHTQFMIHNYSRGTGGKGHEIKAMVEFSDRELNNTFRKIYNGFLTEEEMDSVIDGRDIWLNFVEVQERWDNMQKAA